MSCARTALCLSLAGTLAAAALPARAWDAVPADVQRLMEAEIDKACGARGGRFDSGVHQNDLTGDRQPDLILDHGGITCNGAMTRSGYCGVQACSVFLFVRRDEGLELIGELLGGVVDISPTPVPLIAVFEHGGAVYNWRWNGETFVNIGK